MVLVAAQLGLRGWALGGGWFYADDFVLLVEAGESSPTPAFLLTPHDSQLMPAGRLASWVVAEAGPYSWATAAAIVLVLQLGASLACWWMLRTMFGPRPLSLGLLVVYLFSPMTLTAFMWWAAAINAVPLQLAFFVTVTFHVRHLRTHRVSDLAGAVAGLVLGLLFFVKAALVVLPLAALTLLWFGDHTGPWRTRVVRTVVRHRTAVAVYSALLAAYVVLYVATTPNPLASDAGEVPWGDLADTMLRVALPTSLLGGPWEWSFSNPPVGTVATPEWMVTATWVALAVALTLGVRSRRLDVRAAAVVVPYVVVSYLLVARGRGVFIGGFAGLELRYLADTLPVLVLGLGLLLAPPLPRPTPLPRSSTRPRRPRAHAVALTGGVVVLAVGALRSTVVYAGAWHEQNAAHDYVTTVQEQSARARPVVADLAVPDLVLSPLHHPDNLISRFFEPLGDDRPRAVELGNDLDVLDAFGTARPAAVVASAGSPDGPLPGCGFAVTESRTTVPLEGTPGYFWWMEISYLAPVDAQIEVAWAGNTRNAPVREGAHRLFLKGEGAVAPLVLRMTTPDTAVCVDRVHVGEIESVTLP